MPSEFTCTNFSDLRHVPAVSRLVKDDVDLVERRCDCVAIAQVALEEFCLFVNPRRFTAAMRLRLKIIESAHPPALTHEKIDNVRANQARAAGNERAFHFV